MSAYAAHSGQMGALGEAKVTARLIECGFVVSLPQAYSARYDMIVETADGTLLRVQVKTAWYDENKDAVRAELRGTNYNGGAKTRTTYSSDEVDAFAIYNQEHDECYWFWFDEAPAKELCRKLDSMRANPLDRIAVENLERCVHCGEEAIQATGNTPVCSGECWHLHSKGVCPVDGCERPNWKADMDGCNKHMFSEELM